MGEVAARDQKHGPRICLENYVLLQRTFQARRLVAGRGHGGRGGPRSVVQGRSLCSRPGTAPLTLAMPSGFPQHARFPRHAVQSRREGPLADVAQRVDTECHAAEAAYIEQQVDYFGFTPVLALSRVRGSGAHHVLWEWIEWG